MLVVRMFMLMQVIADQHVNLGPGEAPAAHLAHFEACTDIERRSSFLKKAEWHTSTDEGAKQHVAADPGKALQISNAHRRKF